MSLDGVLVAIDRYERTIADLTRQVEELTDLAKRQSDELERFREQSSDKEN